MSTSRTNLDWLLRLLGRPALQRIARAYDLEPLRSNRALTAELLALEHVDPGEIAREVLEPGDVAQLCEALGIVRTRNRTLRTLLARRLRFLPYEEACALVSRLGLENVKDYRRWHRANRPADLPLSPDGVYRDCGWVRWPDYLGTRRYGARGHAYRPFEEARAFVHKLQLTSEAEWVAWCRGERPDLPSRPADIPICPRHAYKAEWRSLSDWLGSTKHFRGPYRSQAETQALARAHSLRTQEEYRAWARSPLRPHDVPCTPQRTYRSTWTGWGDFLGTGNASSPRRFRTFVRARAFVRKLGLRSLEEWHAWCRGDLPGRPARPADIPTNPWRTYKGRGWIDAGDWLGTGAASNVSRNLAMWPFRKARRYVHRLRFAGWREFQAWCRGDRPDLPPRPPELPANPARTYADDWVSYRDWLGQDRPKRRVR